MSAQDDARRSDLAATAKALADEVGRLSLALEQLGRRTDKQQKVLHMTVIGLVLDVVLSLAVGAGYYQITGVVNAQEQLRANVVCPVIAYLIGGFNPESRAPGAAREVAQNNVAVQRDIFYNVLACRNQLVPPRTDLQTIAPAPPPR